MDEPTTGGGPLAGLRVVDAATGIAGPVAAMFLGDLGAEVVKVEPPTGDPSRDEPGWSVWNRNKRVATLEAAGVDPGAGLWPTVDVVVTDTVLGPRDRLDERTVHLVAPPYLPGATWPHDRESDASLTSALFGIAMRQFSDGPGPVHSVPPVVPFVHGVWAAVSAVAALVERERSGLGQVVTVGGVHGAMVACGAGLEIDTGMTAAPRGGDSGGRVPFYRTYRCGDGRWLFLAALTPRFTELAFAALGIEDLPDDPRLEGGGRAAMLLAENVPWVTARIADTFATEPRDQWLDRLHDAGCPSGPVLDRDDWLDHPQLDAIGMRVERDERRRGHVVMPGVPLELHRTPGSVRTAAPDPTAPETTPVQWSAPLWDLPDPQVAVASGDVDPAGPLDGVRVLDLGAIIAGPYAGSLLAELGADVVKVEPPAGDSFRGPGFGAYNKGQRSLSIDLRQPAGRDALLALARSADVVIDNYRPGVLGRLGLDIDALESLNPSVVSLSITGFGDHGPLGSEAGFDPVLQAMSGMMSSQGGDGPPVFFSVPVNDVTTAATAALGAGVAVLHARRTGLGQKVTTSLAAVSALLQGGEVVRYPGRPAPPVGGLDYRGPDPTHRLYAAADGWIRLLADPDEAGPERVALVGLDEPTEADIGGWVVARGRDDAVAELCRAGIPAVAVREPHELVDDPEITAAEVLRPDPRPGRGGRWTAGRFALLSRTPVRPTALAPRLGEHSVEVLGEAGYDTATIDQLVADGVVIAPA